MGPLRQRHHRRPHPRGPLTRSQLRLPTPQGWGYSGGFTGSSRGPCVRAGVRGLPRTRPRCGPRSTATGAWPRSGVGQVELRVLVGPVGVTFVEGFFRKGGLRPAHGALEQQVCPRRKLLKPDRLRAIVDSLAGLETPTLLLAHPRPPGLGRPVQYRPRRRLGRNSRPPPLPAADARRDGGGRCVTDSGVCRRRRSYYAHPARLFAPRPNGSSPSSSAGGSLPTRTNWQPTRTAPRRNRPTHNPMEMAELPSAPCKPSSSVCPAIRRVGDHRRPRHLRDRGTAHRRLSHLHGTEPEHRTS